MADQREGERILGLDPGETSRGIEHGTEAFVVGQLTGLGGDGAGDLLELVSSQADRAR